jgi:diamine N-acetyltransferase
MSGRVTNVPYSRFALHEYIASATGDIYVDKQVR